MQNVKSQQLLADIGLTNTTITGDTRFDRVLQICEQAKVLPIAEQFVQGKKAFIAGSSWLPDEEIFISYFNEHPDWKLIIAPHVIGEDHLKQIEHLLGNRKVVRYSTFAEAGTGATEGVLAEASALIVDCFGLLSSIYRYATVAYVGGGFGVGIHNVLEAAVWGVPVIFGPNNQKFQEAQELKAVQGGFDIQGPDDFKRLMDQFSSDAQLLQTSGQASAAYVKSKAGATQLILDSVPLK